MAVILRAPPTGAPSEVGIASTSQLLRGGSILSEVMFRTDEVFTAHVRGPVSIRRENDACG